MTAFDDRERAFEAKHAADETNEFKAQAKRDRMLAQWAGDKLGLTGAALEDYVLAVWRADLQHPGDVDVLDKLMTDFDAQHLHISPDEVRHAMAEFMAKAREEVAAG